MFSIVEVMSTKFIWLIKNFGLKFFHVQFSRVLFTKNGNSQKKFIFLKDKKEILRLFSWTGDYDFMQKHV